MRACLIGAAVGRRARIPCPRRGRITPAAPERRPLILLSRNNALPVHAGFSLRGINMMRTRDQKIMQSRLTIISMLLAGAASRRRRFGGAGPAAISRPASGLLRRPPRRVSCAAPGLSPRLASRAGAWRSRLPGRRISSAPCGADRPCRLCAFHAGAARGMDAWPLASPVVARPLRLVVECGRRVVLVYGARLSLSDRRFRLLLRRAAG